MAKRKDVSECGSHFVLVTFVKVVEVMVRTVDILSPAIRARGFGKRTSLDYSAVVTEDMGIKSCPGDDVVNFIAEGRAGKRLCGERLPTAVVMLLRPRITKCS